MCCMQGLSEVDVDRAIAILTAPHENSVDTPKDAVDFT